MTLTTRLLIAVRRSPGRTAYGISRSIGEKSSVVSATLHRLWRTGRLHRYRYVHPSDQNAIGRYNHVREGWRYLPV